MKSHFQSYEMLTLSLPVNIAIMLMSSYMELMGHVQFLRSGCNHYILLRQHFISFKMGLHGHVISLEIGQCLSPPHTLICKCRAL